MKPAERHKLLAKIQGIPAKTREAVRRAHLQLDRLGRKVTVNEVQERAEVDRTACGDLLRAVRCDLLDVQVSWERIDAAPKGKTATPATETQREETPAPPHVDDLLGKIAAATTPSGTADVANAVARLVAIGQLDSTAARVILDAVSEQRRGLVDAPKLGKSDDPENILMCSAEALPLARAFDFLIDGRRRAAILRFAELQLEEDRKDFPDDQVDTGALEGPGGTGDLLTRRGLDHHGEPVLGENDPGLLAIAGLTLAGPWVGPWAPTKNVQNEA